MPAAGRPSRIDPGLAQTRMPAREDIRVALPVDQAVAANLRWHSPFLPREYRTATAGDPRYYGWRDHFDKSPVKTLVMTGGGHMHIFCPRAGCDRRGL